MKYKWGELVEGKKYFPLHQGQKTVLQSTRRFTAAISGTGGGKTVLGPLWVTQRIQKLLATGTTRGMVGMIIAPTYKILSRATMPTFIETMRGTSLYGRFLKSDGIYVLPRGLGAIYALSADVPEGLEGGQLDIGAWIDEGGQVTKGAWEAICRRTGVNQAPILITTTPYTANWLKLDVYDSFKKGDTNYCVVNWSSIKNPKYPKDEYERAKKKLTKARFQMMYNGEFMSAEGLVFPNFSYNIVGKEFERFQSEVGNFGGMDFGFGAPFCALFGKRFIYEGRVVLYIYKERYQSRCTINEHIPFLDKSFYWFADPSRPESIQDLRVAGFNVLPANNQICSGIDIVNELINTKRLFISEDCTNLITEASVYCYPEGEEKDKPVGDLDHAMDALRYVCMGAFPRYLVRDPQKVHVKETSFRQHGNQVIS